MLKPIYKTISIPVLPFVKGSIKQPSRAALLMTALLFSFLAAFGQTSGSGGITGTVTDPKQGVVTDAAVVVRNTETGNEQHLTTNSAGIYFATFLQPGRYDVTVTKEGFATLQQKDLLVQVGEKRDIDFQLQLKQSSEIVDVSSQALLIDPEKTENSEVVSQTLVQNLPIAGRRWDNFVLLTPAVTNDGGNGLVSYRGISGLYNANSVDGANNNQAFFSEARGRTTVPYVYSLDSIREFQVSTNNYSAEFGQAAGGVVNSITKSGTNDFHGDLFYYLRYPTWNALDPINKAAGVYTQPVHQQQQFGGSGGGPIIKDKLFFFLTYDGSRKVFPVTYTSTSKFPLACNVLIPLADCAAANSYLSSLLGAFPRYANQDVAFGKLDWQINSRNRVSADFNWEDFHAPNSYNSGYTISNNSVTANGLATTHNRAFVANYDTTISSTAVNNLRFQWGVDFETIGSNAPGPSVSIANVSAYGEPNALPRPAFPDENRYQIADTYSWSIGRHTIKAGVDINLIHDVLINLFQGGGIYAYNGAASTSFNNWVADVYGIDLGDHKTGKHYSTFTQVTDPITGVGKDDFWNNNYAGFVEDSWKALPNLTINAGLRYEIQTVPQPPMPNTHTPLLTDYTSHINIDSNNWAPRIGLAWQVDQKTVVRTGYGMFYGLTSNSTFYAIRVENGIYQQQFNCGPTAACGPVFPNVIFTPPGPPVAAPFPGALTPQIINTNPPLGVLVTHGLVQDFVNPLVHEGEFTVERQLPGNMTLSVGYVMGRGLHLPVFIDANLLPATTTRTYDVTNTAGTTLSTITEPFYTQRANPQTGVILNGYSIVNSWYNGAIISLRKPMSHGLELLLNYTFAKSQDTGAVPGAFGTFYGTDSTLNPMSQKQESALSDLNQTQRFVGSAVWAPGIFAHLSNTPARLILNGWSFSTIVTVATGQPVTGQISGFPSGEVDGGVTGGVVSNGGSSIGGRIPMVGRNTFDGPGLVNVDFRVMRQFSITERFKFQLIGEAFNIFNHTNFNSVNTTAYFYDAPGTSVCTVAGHTHGCLVPNPQFLAPTSSSDALYGARQLQISGKLTF